MELETAPATGDGAGGVDAASTSTSIPVNLWCFLGKEGTKYLKTEINFQKIDLKTLKELVAKSIGSVSPNEIDIHYNGCKLRDDAAVQAAEFRPLNVIVVIKHPVSKESPVDVAAASKSAASQAQQVAIALKTAFKFNPEFIPTIEKLGQSDMLDNILAIAPGLKDDPVGIAIIQDPAMIYHLSDVESLKKLAAQRPWVIEAFNFLTGSVHQQKGQGSSGRSNPPLFNPLFDDEDDDMDDEDGAAGGAASVITREQLSAALNSLNALGRGGLAGAFGGMPTPTPTQTQRSQNSGGGSGSGAGPSFMDFFNQATAGLSQPGANPTTTSAPTPNLTPDMGNLMASALSGATGGQPLTPDMVARAMTTALNSLPPDARQTRFNELRDQISRIQNMGNSTTPNATPNPISPVTVTQQPTAAAAPTSQAPATGAPNPTSGSGSGGGQYQSQLHQMREMGIHDENLSILALRVSDGDVGTAVDLIFSGWTGEGADVRMSDEE